MQARRRATVPNSRPWLKRLFGRAHAAQRALADGSVGAELAY
jgi:hypothetical protein